MPKVKIMWYALNTVTVCNLHEQGSDQFSSKALGVQRLAVTAVSYIHDLQLVDRSIIAGKHEQALDFRPLLNEQLI